MTEFRNTSRLREAEAGQIEFGDDFAVSTGNGKTGKTKRADMDSAASVYFSYIRKNRTKLLRKYGDPLSFCRRLINDPVACPIPDDAQILFTDPDVDHRHYIVASTYALLIGEERRRELSAYFTPPALAKAAIRASVPFLQSSAHPTVLDPACGGGSFLTPMTRYLVGEKLRRGMSVRNACTMALKDIRGIELDPGLAALSQALLKDMLEHTYNYLPDPKLKIVRCADTLSARQRQLYDLVIGNPPYGKVGAGADCDLLKKAGLADLGGHTNLYSLFLLQSLRWVKPNGGLVFVLPTSFVAGPYFAGLRQEIMARADVLSIDLHEQRENLFLGAIQDVCILTLRRHQSGTVPGERKCAYKLGIIDPAGGRTACGTDVAGSDGEPWMLPVAPRRGNSAALAKQPGKAQKHEPHVLADYGYRIRVGKVVPTRERKRLHLKRKKGDFPLVWASAIRPDGSYDFKASGRLGNAAWYGPPGKKDVPYATKRAAIVVQRTSNRDQERRLNAAAVPGSFRARHKRGFIAENHVIVIEATHSRPDVTPTMLAKLLNSKAVNDRFSAVTGSFSVSARLLDRMALPPPDFVKRLKKERFEQGLRRWFSHTKDVLAPPPSGNKTRDTQDGIDKSGNLRRRRTVNKNARLKRRAVTRAK